MHFLDVGGAIQSPHQHIRRVWVTGVDVHEPLDDGEEGWARVAPAACWRSANVNRPGFSGDSVS